jgi:hypothetical protein
LNNKNLNLNTYKSSGGFKGRLPPSLSFNLIKLYVGLKFGEKISEVLYFIICTPQMVNRRNHSNYFQNFLLLYLISFLIWFLILLSFGDLSSLSSDSISVPKWHCLLTLYGLYILLSPLRLPLHEVQDAVCFSTSLSSGAARPCGNEKQFRCYEILMEQRIVFFRRRDNRFDGWCSSQSQLIYWYSPLYISTRLVES